MAKAISYGKHCRRFSIRVADAGRLLRLTRQHWGIENKAASLRRHAAHPQEALAMLRESG